jgi:hypothetical protein
VRHVIYKKVCLYTLLPLAAWHPETLTTAASSQSQSTYPATSAPSSENAKPKAFYLFHPAMPRSRPIVNTSTPSCRAQCGLRLVDHGLRMGKRPDRLRHFTQEAGSIGSICWRCLEGRILSTSMRGGGLGI